MAINHFMDSGAFTLQKKAEEWAKANGKKKWDFYDTQEHWQFLDNYANFVKKYAAGIDFYANVDAIPHPEITWRNQQYLEEKHKLKPVPVIHNGCDLKWLKHYMDHGYDYIGVGGSVGTVGVQASMKFFDKLFDFICKGKDRLPKVKLHGFGVTGYTLITRYCWWSVDSTAWIKYSLVGAILMPVQRKGKFVFDEPPRKVPVSVTDKADEGRIGSDHFVRMTESSKKIVTAWLDQIDIPLGKASKDREVLEDGVMTNRVMRCKANLAYYDHLKQSLPEWPWKFEMSKKVTLFKEEE